MIKTRLHSCKYELGSIEITEMLVIQYEIYSFVTAPSVGVALVLLLMMLS